MKNHFYVLLCLVFVMVGCDNDYEDIHRYTKIISQSKAYPLYLDMSEIADIQVKSQQPLQSPFKIVANDKYYFVGDRLNGIHVFTKSAGTPVYLCFIACKYIKDMEIVDNQLYCNNFVDLVVLDVNNPLQTTVLHRQKYHFNRFTSYKEYWNYPSAAGKGIIAGSELHTLTDTITDKNPTLDFTEFDQLYDHLSTKVIPETWFNSEDNRPYIGMVKVGANEVYNYGRYNSWDISSYQSGSYSLREEDSNSTPRGKYAPPYYYSDAWPVRVFTQDNMIFILGWSYGNSGYCDYINYNNSYPASSHIYFSEFKPLDITYIPAYQTFYILSGQSIWGAWRNSDPNQSILHFFKNFNINSDATSIFSSENYLITLGNQLSVYSASQSEIRLIKNYPEISGECYLKTGNVLAVVHLQNLTLYDISDLENIKVIH